MQKTNNKFLNINNFIFFIVLFIISIDGLEFFGISLSKLVLVLYNIFLFAVIFMNGQKLCIKITPFLIFYLLTAISSILAVFYKINNNESIYSSLFNYFIQILFIYIPLYITIFSTKEIINWKKILLKNLLKIAKIHAIYGLLQFCLYYFFSFDINSVIFNGILKQSTNWSCLYNTGTEIVLRITSFNHESAIYCFILAVGFFSTKKLGWKAIFIIANVLSYSRTGILMIILPLFILMLRNLSRKIKTKNIFIAIIILITIVLIVAIVPTLRNFALRVISRFNFSSLSSQGDGTDRHIMYYPATVEIILKKANIIQALFGFGPRTCGVVFNIYNSEVSYLSLPTSTIADLTPWAPECDVLAILLGHGIIGFVFYYFSLFWCAKYSRENNLLVFIIFIGGITYYLYPYALINIILMIFSMKSIEGYHK